MNKSSKRQNASKYDSKLKIAVAREYLTSDLGYKGLGTKYNIPGSTVQGFVKWYKRKFPEAIVEPPLEAIDIKPQDQSALQITALQMLIETASKELGIDLVKKFGTKQQKR